MKFRTKGFKKIYCCHDLSILGFTIKLTDYRRPSLNSPIQNPPIDTFVNRLPVYFRSKQLFECNDIERPDNVASQV